jgi:hypothetical protein
MTPALLVLSTGLWAAAAAQIPAPPPERPVVELSFSRASGRAGEEVELPVSLKSEELVAAPFRITLKFKSSELEYRGLKRAYLAEFAGWTMKAERRNSDAGTAIVEIDVTPAGGDFFPSGVVAYAQFRIQKNAPQGDISLAAALLLPPSVPLTAKAEPAKVTVYTKFVMSCFFYMH